MNLIEECKGRVLWHLCGDTAVDLHRDGLAMDVIRKEAAEGNGVELSFSDSGDYCRFVFFMLGRQSPQLTVCTTLFVPDREKKRKIAKSQR